MTISILKSHLLEIRTNCSIFCAPIHIQFSSVAQSCPILCDPMDYSIPGFPAHHQLPEVAQIHVHRVGDAIQASHPLSPLLLLSSVFPSIRVFSSESALCITWLKYWSFSFSISPSSEYSGLTSFSIDWIDLLAVQDFQEPSPTAQLESINSTCSASFIVQISHP